MSKGKKPYGAIGFEYINRFAKALKKVGVGPRGYDGVAIENNIQMIKIDGKYYPLSRTWKNRLLEEWGEDKQSELTKALQQDIKALHHFIHEDTEEYESQLNESHAKAKDALKKYRRSRIG